MDFSRKKFQRLIKIRSLQIAFLILSISSGFLYVHVKHLTRRISLQENPFLLGNTRAASGLASPSQLLLANGMELQDNFRFAKLIDTPDPMKLNNTRKAQVELIVFSRVPKVGSEMLTELLRVLGARNNFSVFRSAPARYERVVLSEHEQIDLSGVLSNLPQPATYTQHITYIDFKKYNHPKPIFINLVRNPVDRMISWFYYSRSAWKLAMRMRKFPNETLPDVQWLRKDFETCVLEKDLECSFVKNSLYMGRDHRRQMMFFCGSDPECRPFDSQETFDKAINNLENEYAVVGLLEDLNTTLTVFEKYIPRFFHGATAAYYENYDHFKQINTNNFKPTIRDEIRELVRLNMTKEFEFYELCKKRLKLQFLAVEKSLY